MISITAVAWAGDIPEPIANSLPIQLRESCDRATQGGLLTTCMRDVSKWGKGHLSRTRRMSAYFRYLANFCGSSKLNVTLHAPKCAADLSAHQKLVPSNWKGALVPRSNPWQRTARAAQRQQQSPTLANVEDCRTVCQTEDLTYLQQY